MKNNKMGGEDIMTEVQKLKKRISENKRLESRKSAILTEGKIIFKKLNAEVKTNGKGYGMELEEIIKDCMNSERVIKRNTVFKISSLADVFYDVKFIRKDKNNGTIYLELV